MADPKFQYLPYIAHDQPDVYETPDVNEAETSDYDEDEPVNDAIERLHISTKDSIGKFRGKYLTGEVDFSDGIGRKNRLGYDARSLDYELAGEGERETPLQRCHRLKCEMNELMEEIEASRADTGRTAEEKASHETVFGVVSTAKKVLESLKLEQVIGSEVVAGGAGGGDAEAKKLIAQIEEYRKTGAVSSSDPKVVANELVQSARVAQLEHRLHQLEVAVGAKPERISRLAGTTGTGNLIEAVQNISAKAALLQPSQLDTIEQRLNNLLQQMNSIQEKSNATGQDPNREQKILELYEIAKSTEPIVQVLPDILNRMLTLESLHKYATNFSKLFAELETTQASILNGVAANKTLLTGVQEAFAQNLENVNKEVKKLEERMTKLQQMIK
ncbi:AGAP011690-PA [Anopheles gambiae str. PEST]|uniref:Dynactin subunit 2 n=2 Tax=gambiae species complex TaxID=44542 RepID=DCTN2_ANOGA|nr:RecName: Full=Dynactin subunit 2; AltName: Full=Dynactin 2 p50 subunit [Anopheles gambiae]EAA00075.3 AGAP011690-PA [Anopheles gambiae str. PEST]